MSWPSNTINETSAAAAWSRITGQAAQARRLATTLRVAASGGQLRMRDLRAHVLDFRIYRQTLNQLGDTTGLQQYARLVSGATAFDLSVESAALLAAYSGAISEMRALHNSLADSINAGGDIVESPREGINPTLCSALITALSAVEASIEPTGGIT